MVNNTDDFFCFSACKFIYLFLISSLAIYNNLHCFAENNFSVKIVP